MFDTNKLKFTEGYKMFVNDVYCILQIAKNVFEVHNTSYLNGIDAEYTFRIRGTKNTVKQYLNEY